MKVCIITMLSLFSFCLVICIIINRICDKLGCNLITIYAENEHYFLANKKDKVRLPEKVTYKVEDKKLIVDFNNLTRKDFSLLDVYCAEKIISAYTRKEVYGVDSSTEYYWLHDSDNLILINYESFITDKQGENYGK